MANSHLVLLGLLCAVQQIACIGYYTVLAPRVLRPNSEYHVAVSTQMVSEPTTVIVGIVGTESGGGKVDISQSVTVEPYSTQTVKLEIPDLGPGTYNLTATGTDGLLFTNTTTLDYAHKSHSVFIQTDKAEYKPGQKIQFRAIAVDAHLKPSVTSALDIYISDGKGNRVKQWTQAELTKGVFSGELQLSDLPVLGDWTITVSLLGDTFTKVFEVAEYVLPKFEVTVDAPTDVSVQDSRIVATVHAKYTYGKAVEGEATITVSPYSPYQPASQNPVSKIVSIDGDAVVEFDIARDLRLTVDYDTTVQVDVSVAEALTGRVQNTTFEVNLHKYKYKMDVIKTSDYFKPGLMYTAFVKVSYYDGSPVQDQDNPVTVRYNFHYDQEYIVEQHKLSKDGTVEVNLYTPADSNQTVLNLQADYLEITGYLSSVDSASSPSNTFIQAVLVTQNPTVNGDIELDINSTESIKYFSYQVNARGDVVTANTVVVDNEKTYRLKFPATYDMTPTAHVVVYYVKDDGEVIADAVNIDLDGALQNFVNISINPTEAEPGNNVEMTIETKPNSYVGLLAVDQSVLLLKSGNDITQESVTEELKSYDTISQSQSMNFGGISPLYWWPGSATARQIFDNSGDVILTNGLVPESPPLIYYYPVAVMNGAPVPEAAPAGGAGGSAPASSAAPVRVRSNFPETWIWQMVEAGDDGKQTIQETAPDTITSWVITGFSLDPVYGLGLSQSTKLTVFRPFFISLDLPYSVIRGEIVSVPIVVFNYMTQDVVADVTLENEQLENFEFVDIGDGVNGQTKLDPDRSKRVSVKANSGSSVSFMIVPKKLGQVTIKVTATSSLAGDSVVTNLLVKPEGETQYSNKAVFVDLKNKNSFNTSIILDIPNNIVEGSDIVEISAIGDVLGPSISNLDNLLTMPTGCGEQNMLGFVPDIVVIEYLKSSNQLTSEIETKALQYMEIGYQRELTYRHSDASFSAFGDSDPSGSTWLTAFVAKSFHQAVPYITIDEKVIQDALYWLSTKQSPSGSFPEVGAIVHKDMQGDAANGLALTAYALIAFLENQQETDLYTDTINKALDNIVKNLDGVDDVYALALSNYALNLAQHPMKDVAFNMFESKAQSSGDMKWWTKPIQADDENPWYSLPNSVDVEMTAYGLLTYLLRGMAPDSLPIMKWLVSQRNERGGFASTQDTVIGLQALAKLAATFASSDTDITVSFSYPGGRASPLKVNKENSLVLQMQELPETVRKVDITATGTGFALVQVAYQYNLNDAGTWPLFTLDIQVQKNSNSIYLYLSICSGFIGSEGVDESNMAVMEVNLPSGYTIDSDSLPSLKVTQYVKRVETRDGDTVVVLYFEKMTKQEYCVSVSAFRTYKVAKQKPVPVTIYDYYDSSRRARTFYEHTVSSLCDICDGDDCGTACS